MKNITLITLFVGALAFITSASAAVSGNLGVTTDYVWRGQSQSNGNSAVSGGMDYAGAGYYAGVWTSSTENIQETNFYVGTEINGFDVGVISYEYSGAKVDSDDASEAYVGYSISGFDLSYEQDLDESKNEFLSISYGLPTIIDGVSATLTYGDVSKKNSAKDYDYMQLDLAYGDLVLSIVDEDTAGTSTALSYSWAL